MPQNKRRFIDCLHVFVLTQFALVQPLLYRLSRRTVYLEDQGIEAATVLWLVAFLCLVLPALLWLFEAVAGLVSESARERTHAGIAFMLLAAILMPVLKLVGFLPGLLVLAFSVGLAALALWAYRRFTTAKLLVTVAALAIVVFPAQFLFFSPVSRYLFPRNERPQVPVEAKNPVPVVIFLFDEFCGTSLMDRQEQIDAARYPHFAALAETATWYRNATSVHPRTEMAVPAIMTGNYPRGRRPATIAEYPTNLFELLDSTGQYEFVVFEPYTRLCRPQPDEPPANLPRSQQWSELAGTLPLVYLQHLFPVDLPFELPFVPLEWNAVKRAPPERPNTRTGVFRFHWNSGRAEQFEEFLRRIEPPGRPALYFAHVVVPHFPWCFLPSGYRYTPDDGRQASFPGTTSDLETWGNDELTVLHGYQRYLLQVGYADYLLGKLMDRLQALQLFDECLFVALADHGVSFHPGRSRRLPDDETLPDIAAIPLFIKLPHQSSGQTSDRNVESIDVLPTTLDVLDLSQQPVTDGSSLVKPTCPERTKKQFFDDARMITMDAAFPSKRTTLARLFELFGDGSEPDRLFRIGPHSELIGRSVEELTVAERTGVHVDLIEPSAVPKPELTPFLPCYFSGRVKPRDATKQPVVLAIAINGVIRAVTRTYSDKKISDTWAAMVPETALQRGTVNSIQIFIVSTVGDRPTLQPALAAPLRLPVAE
jgi:hypothetical protein